MRVAQLWHVEAAADFDVVPAREVFLLVIHQPPRNVYVHAADAVAIVPR